MAGASRSPALAALTARYLVVDRCPSQAAFMVPDHLAHSDPLVERFERWARRQLADGFSLSEAAQAAVTSERTLARRLQSVLGKSRFRTFRIFASSARCIYYKRVRLVLIRLPLRLATQTE